ncbi:MAG: DNA primase [Elusimicrobia bacterium]|nr:DNA primase [Elusimicrobiota bacterium]
MASNSAIESIREKLDIVDVVKDYVPALRRAGRNYKAPCPFHNEKTPSFTVSPDKQIFYCFGCNEGGDIFTFVMKIEGLTFPEAARKLAQKAGLSWEDRHFTGLSAADRENLEIKKALAAACEFYKKFLFSSGGEKARLYLGARKINKATVEAFGLGYAPSGDNALTQELLGKGFSKDLLSRAGLSGLRDSDGSPYDYFRGRIMFPIKTQTGTVTGFGGRILDSGEPKYLNSPETPVFSKRKTLYGLDRALAGIRKSGRLLLLEGYMDVISAHQHGVDFAVAPLGTALTMEHASFIKRYAKDTIIMFDPDAAGIKASVRAAEIFMEAGLYSRIAELDAGLDPDEYLNENGPEAFAQKISDAADPLDFRMNLFFKNRAAVSSQDKARAIDALLETVLKQGDEILKSEWVKNIAFRFEVSEISVLQQLKKKSQVPGKERKPDETSAPQSMPALELGFIQLLLKDPELAVCAEGLEESDLSHPLAKRIFSEIKNLKPEERPRAAAALIARLPEEASLIMKLAVADIPSDINPAQNAAKTVKMLKKNSHERRRKELSKNYSTLTPSQLEELKHLTELRGKAGEL